METLTKADAQASSSSSQSFGTCSCLFFLAKKRGTLEGPLVLREKAAFLHSGLREGAVEQAGGVGWPGLTPASGIYSPSRVNLPPSGASNTTVAQQGTILCCISSKHSCVLLTSEKMQGAFGKQDR